MIRSGIQLSDFQHILDLRLASSKVVRFYPLRTVWMKALALWAFLVLGGLIYGTSAIAHDQITPRVAFFGFQLINTSLEPTTPAENERIRMLGDLLRQKLEASGHFIIVPIPAELREKLVAGPKLAIATVASGTSRDKSMRIGSLGVPSKK